MMNSPHRSAITALVVTLSAIATVALSVGLSAPGPAAPDARTVIACLSPKNCADKNPVMWP